jgi:hypothetical protein
MSVPNTNSFSLQDVVDEINPTSDDLATCVAEANSVGFDTEYYTAPATSLYEFRNYIDSSNLYLTSGGTHVNIEGESTTSQNITYTWKYVSYTGTKPTISYSGSNRSVGYTTPSITNSFATDQFNPFTITGNNATVTLEFTLTNATVDSISSNNTQTISIVLI